MGVVYLLRVRVVKQDPTKKCPVCGEECEGLRNIID